jgi:hypothetical protein
MDFVWAANPSGRYLLNPVWNPFQQHDGMVILATTKQVSVGTIANNGIEWS